MIRFRHHLVLLFCSILLLFFLGGTAFSNSVRAQDDRRGRNLPTLLCALSEAQVRCYVGTFGEVRTVSTPGQTVTDFAISPDNLYVAYRHESTIQIGNVYGGAAQIVDREVYPPARLDQLLSTITWSPDGRLLAYITANGFRIAYASGGETQTRDVMDRLYIALKFSPDGSRIAAQAEDESWNIFNVVQDESFNVTLTRTHYLPGAADLAWVDPSSVVVAARAGGVQRLDISESVIQVLWAQPADTLVRLSRSVNGEVYALRRDMSNPMGAEVGRAVSISPGGTIEALRGADALIDVRVTWAIDGQLMAYVTSGTPILVDPVSGEENMIMIADTNITSWGELPPESVERLLTDTDLYFLAQSGENTAQVWRLPSNALDPAAQISQQAESVRAFAVSPDRQQLALAVGARLIIAPIRLSGIETPIAPDEEIQLAEIASSGEVSLDWRRDGVEIVYADATGVYAVPVNAVSPPRRILRSTADAPYTEARYSSDGGYVLVRLAYNQWNVFDTNGQPSTLPQHQIPERVLYATWRSDGAVLYHTATGVGAGDRVLLDSAYPVVAVQPTGDSALVVRRIGWSGASGALQLATTTGEVRTPLRLDGFANTPSLALSPTGQFLAGAVRLADGRIDALCILDLNTGRRVVISGVSRVTSLRWVVYG
jgi:WD40 repeat protein